MAKIGHIKYQLAPEGKLFVTDRLVYMIRSLEDGLEDLKGLARTEDKEAASLMGVDIDKTISVTFIIGGAAAGAAGVLYALVFKQVFFMMGFIPGIKAFTAAVLGGIGNIPGAMLGGLLLGLLESLGPSLFLDGYNIAAPYQLKDAIAFLVLVLVLIFRPTGLLGERLAVKKA